MALRPLELQFDLLHCVSIKHRAADALIRLKTREKNRIPFKDEIEVLSISQKYLEFAPSSIEPSRSQKDSLATSSRRSAIWQVSRTVKRWKY